MSQSCPTDMEHATIAIDGVPYRCQATSYAWPLGVGVDISLCQDQARVALVRILCPADSEEYEAIAALSEADCVSLALNRFVAGKLNVTPESLLESRRRFEAASDRGVVAIIASFQVRHDGV